MAALIKELWFYHRSTEYIPSDEVIEKKSDDLALEIRQELETSIEKNNDRIAEIMKSHPNASEQTDAAGFEVTQMAKDSLEILKDMGIEYDDWIEASVDNEWTIRTLKIWFFLLGEQSAWA